MNFKLRLLIITCLWFSLSALLVCMLYSEQQQKTEQRTQQMLHRDLAAHMRDDSPLMQGTDYNPSALKSIFHTLMLLGPDFEIYFLDQQGNIRSHAAPDGRAVMGKVDLNPIQQFLTQEELPILGTDPRNPHLKKVFSAAPITQFDSVIGYLYVVIGSEQRGVLASQSSYVPLFAMLALSFGLIVSFSFLVYLLVKRTLLNPIENVTLQLHSQSKEDFRLRPDFVKQVPELKPIAKHFYLMSQRIQQQFLQLQHEEHHRRELLMQLSHDLKTPLSSILGYLETWQMQQKSHDPLIDTAHRNANKLAEQLKQQLSLARAHRPYLEPHFEPVELAPIIAETEESLAIDAKRKKVLFQTDIQQEERIIGDKQLLLRLFANLFENAIRHSPCDHNISMTVRKKGKFLHVEIVNKVDKSAPKGQLGVGIRIIQSILMLHHSQLFTKQDSEVYSQSFQLAMA